MKCLKIHMLNMLISDIIFFVLAFLEASIFAYTNISDSYLNIFTYIVWGFISFFTSILLNRKLKEKGLLNGLLHSIFMFFSIYLIVSLAFSKFKFDIYTLIVLGISVIFSILGGIIGVNIK